MTPGHQLTWRHDGNITHRHRHMEAHTRASHQARQACRHHTLPTLQSPTRLRTRHDAQQRRGRPPHTALNGRQRPHRQRRSHMQALQPIKRVKSSPKSTNNAPNAQNKPEMVTNNAFCCSKRQKVTGGTTPPPTARSPLRHSEISMYRVFFFSLIGGVSAWLEGCVL